MESTQAFCFVLDDKTDTTLRDIDVFFFVKLSMTGKITIHSSNAWYNLGNYSSCHL